MVIIKRNVIIKPTSEEVSLIIAKFDLNVEPQQLKDFSIDIYL